MGTRRLECGGLLSVAGVRRCELGAKPALGACLLSLWSPGQLSMVRACEHLIADADNSECFEGVSGFVRWVQRQVNTLGENYSTLLTDLE
jgi:hypothetical protein